METFIWRTTARATVKTLLDLTKLRNQQEGAANFTRYLCLLDAVMSERMNLGLGRTQTLAEGAPYCDFRFKWGRETKVTTPKQSEQVEVIGYSRQQKMAEAQTVMQ